MKGRQSNKTISKRTWYPRERRLGTNWEFPSLSQLVLLEYNKGLTHGRTYKYIQK